MKGDHTKFFASSHYVMNTNFSQNHAYVKQNCLKSRTLFGTHWKRTCRLDFPSYYKTLSQGRMNSSLSRGRSTRGYNSFLEQCYCCDTVTVTRHFTWQLRIMKLSLHVLSLKFKWLSSYQHLSFCLREKFWYLFTGM